MELRQGYKQTEVGVIPEDWGVKNLGSILKRYRLGGNYPNQGRETAYPLIKMGNIGRGNIDIGKIEYISTGIQPDDLDRLDYGDLLFNTRNTLELVGKVAIWRNELTLAYYNSNLMRLEFKPEEVSSILFANYVFNSNNCLCRLRAIATGTTSVAAIYTRDLLQFAFPVPQIMEQEAIGTALSDVDAMISGLESLIAKKRDIKYAAMQQLLTGKQRLPEFSGEWEVKKVSEFGDVITGGTPSTQIKEYWEGDIPWVTPTDISGVKDIFVTERRVTTKGLESIRELPPNSVLVTCIASIGKNAILRRKGGCNQQINAIVPNAMNNTDFLYYLFESSKQFLLGNAAMTATSIISKKDFSDLQFYVPSIEEQIAIAAVLSDMDAELAALEQKRDKTRALKQGMMQELLTGRIRLIKPEVTI